MNRRRSAEGPVLQRHGTICWADDLDDTGHYLLREGRVDDAVRVFEWAASAFPESDDVLVSLGQGYVARGAVERAAESYRRALELDPSNEHARSELDRLGM